MKTKIILKKHLLALAVACLVSLSAFSTPLDLRDEPLFLSQSVPPGMVVTFDDSGSMRWGYMPDNRFNGRTKGYYNAWNNNQQVRSFTSPQYNAIYYDPTIIYSPPVDENGISFPNSIYTNAPVEGYGGATNLANVNLSTGYIPVTEIYPSRYGPGQATWRTHQNGVVASGAYYHIWNEALPNPTTSAYYNTMRTAGTGSGLQQYTRYNLNSQSASQKRNFANWYTYYNTRNKLVKAAMSRAFVQFGPDFKLTWQVFWDGTLDNTTQSSNMGLFDGVHRKDFYDWLFGVRATSGTPLRLATRLAGDEFMKKGTGTIKNDSPYWSEVVQQEMSCQQNFHIQISDGFWNSAAGLTGNYDHEDYDFPKLTNGRADTDPLYKSKVYSYNNRSSAPQTIYDAEPADSLADNAFYYWSRDLRDDLDDLVPTFIDDYTRANGTEVIAVPDPWWLEPELFWNPKNDPAQWQHMVTFNIGLGVDGEYNQVTDYPKLRDGTLGWQTALSGAKKIDDVWHASINSRGQYFSAKDPNELVSALDSLINNIIKRTGQASSGSVSSNIISDETLAFKTGYNTSDWTGSVIAANLNNDGTLGEPIWDAGCKLTGGSCLSLPGEPFVTATRDYNSRYIFTYDKALTINKTHEFRTADLSVNQKNALLNSMFINDSLARGDVYTDDEIVQYIRGDRSNETDAGGSFRNRNSLLGDVIHSPARILRGPSASYNDDFWYNGSPEQIAKSLDKSYSKFRADNKDRDNVLLVGANDGMLHAFDAGINTTNGGDELWAYIPSNVLDGLSEIANPTYKHKTFVDSAPFIKDAYIGTGASGKWSTIALGGLRHGGKAFYALDLGSNPKLPPTVMWEFSNSDDSDMGFSYSGGVIARVVAPLNSTALQSKWVAFIPNGYGSNSKKSALFAIDLETGAVLHKWKTTFGGSTNPNGMGPVTAADYVVYDEADTSQTFYGSDQGVDFLYAGDLHGNLYRFDATKVFTDIGGVTTNPHILFDGPKTRSITVAPRIFTPEDGSLNIIVTFGTGKYIEPADKTLDISAQFLIGIKDWRGNTTTSDIGDLVRQKITQTGVIRKLTSNPVGVNQGWKINLRVKVDGVVSKGERLVNGIVRNNQTKDMIVGTIIPAGSNPCLPGGVSWLMILDARTGGSPESGRVLASGTADGLFINDILTGINILSTPGGNDTIITVDGSGGSDGETTIPPIKQASGEKWRRRSWHRILF